MRARQHNAIRFVGYFPNLISIAVRNLTYSRPDSSGMQRMNAGLAGLCHTGSSPTKVQDAATQ